MSLPHSAWACCSKRGGGVGGGTSAGYQARRSRRRPPHTPPRPAAPQAEAARLDTTSHEAPHRSRSTTSCTPQGSRCLRRLPARKRARPARMRAGEWVVCGCARACACVCACTGRAGARGWGEGGDGGGRTVRMWNVVNAWGPVNMSKNSGWLPTLPHLMLGGARLPPAVRSPWHQRWMHASAQQQILLPSP